jgi:CRISPR-associated endonuclease/helicase Cas3
MAGETPFEDHTRFVETSRGILPYRELIPLIAERTLRLEEQIAEGRWRAHPFNWELACAFHAGLCSELFPDWAGRARNVDVTVGTHVPPPSFEVSRLMRDYFENISARLEFAKDDTSGELFLECLSFVEGRFLTIHPFQDFNGRVVRLLLQELCQRLGLTAVDLAPREGDRADYLKALRLGDKSDWSALKKVWKDRFEA